MLASPSGARWLENFGLQRIHEFPLLATGATCSLTYWTVWRINKPVVYTRAWCNLRSVHFYDWLIGPHLSPRLDDHLPPLPICCYDFWCHAGQVLNPCLRDIPASLPISMRFGFLFVGIHLDQAPDHRQKTCRFAAIPPLTKFDDACVLHLTPFWYLAMGYRGRIFSSV